MKKLKIKEIFESIQGEGQFAGEYAIFIRTSGCNLKCDFCDTDHENGQEMTVEFILHEVKKIKIVTGYPILVIITGGEPTLQPGLNDLIYSLKELGYFVAIETNGTGNNRALKGLVDWLTISPKKDTPINCLTKETIGNELKLVYNGQKNLDGWFELSFQNYYLQPESNKPEFIKGALEIIKQNPRWKLSLQLQKIIGVR